MHAVGAVTRGSAGGGDASALRRAEGAPDQVSPAGLQPPSTDERFRVASAHIPALDDASAHCHQRPVFAGRPRGPALRSRAPLSAPPNSIIRHQESTAMAAFNSPEVLSSPDDFRALERARLRALVERNMELALAFHSPEFHLVTPGGKARSRESYLAAVETGAISYLKWQAGEMTVRQFKDVVLLRYQAELEMPSQSGGTSSFVCWHTDSYELHDGLWQVVFSQATRVA